MKSAIVAIVMAAAAISIPSTTGLAHSVTLNSKIRTPTALSMSDEDQDFMRWARASRSASSGDNLVEMKRPLGLILDEDDDGNVFVKTVAPKGNAARTGLVNEGDIVTMCSATFGQQMWSTRGVGLTRVMAAIRVRAGPTVSLVFESQNQRQLKGEDVAKQAQAAREARERAQEKRNVLLKELESDERKMKKGKFLGLF